MEIIEIQKEMELGQLTPSRAAELRVILAGKYSRARDEWDKLETARFIFLNELDDELSEAAKEREWGGTEFGGKWRNWKSQMRKSDRMQNSLSSQIRIAEGEMRNVI